MNRYWGEGVGVGVGSRSRSRSRSRSGSRSRSRSGLLIGGVLLLSAFSINSYAKPGDEKDQKEYQKGEEQLKEFGKLWHNLDEWKARSAAIRQGILHESHLDPPPPKTPLNPIIHSRREYNGYSVENVAFESLPGFYVTGNLYRPLGRTGKVPGILNPHGHFQNPEGRLRPDMQTRCAEFARMGAVAFSYDMVGWGESKQTTHEDPNVLTLQLWDSIRAVDFLLLLDEVDPARIACTGASGGGTQTFLLAAVDDRIAVTAPVVMVSAHFNGGCQCESGLPIHHHPETNNVEIASMMAPKPQLVVSDGSDWTRFTPTTEFPYMWRIYRLYGAEKDLEQFHLPYDGHDYGYSKRAPVYEFFARHLGLQRLPVDATTGKTPPEDVKIEPRQALYAFDAAHPRPANALQGTEAIQKALFAHVAKK